MKVSEIIISSSLNDIRLRALTVETQEEARRGLGGLKSMGDFDCMVFPLDPTRTYVFNTLEMKFDIDMLELTEDQEIKKIHHKVKPGIAAIAIYESAYVIELKGGFCERFGVQEGDRVFEDDVEHRSAIGYHSLASLEKKAQAEGIDIESPDYDNQTVYYDKLLKEIKAYNEARRKSVINGLFRSHEEFDIHSNEPEPTIMN